MLRTTMSSIILLGTLAAFPLTTRADNSVSIRISNSWISDPSFDAVSDDDHFVQAELSYARRLLQLWRGELWAEASYMAGPAKTRLFGGATRTQALLQSVTFSARYAYPVYAWLVPFARFGLGVGVGTFELQPNEDQGAVQDRAAGVAGHASLGLELLWPRPALLHGSSDLTAGLVIEAGYGFGSPLSFELRPQPDEDLKQIPLRGSPMGSLSVNGWQLRVGGVLRF